MNEYYPPGWGLELPKRQVQNREQLAEISFALLADGCIKAITLPNGQMDAPTEHADDIFGGKYFTQIEIWGGEREGVYFHEGLYNPNVSIQSFCNVMHYEDWNYDKKGEKQHWQRYTRGN